MVVLSAKNHEHLAQLFKSTTNYLMKSIKKTDDKASESPAKSRQVLNKENKHFEKEKVV